jgi:hypothetical protein
MGGIEYPSPYATIGRKRRPEGAPRDHIKRVVVLEGCLCGTPYTRPHGRRSVPHRLKDKWLLAHSERRRSLI